MSYCVLKNGKKLHIKAAEEKDAAEIVDMFNVLGGESDNLTFEHNDYYFNENQERTFIKLMKERKNSLFIIGVIDNKIVGNLTFVATQRDRLIHRGEMGISILKNYWGVGIGSALIEHLLAWARLNGVIKKIELQVRQDNISAVELYKKWGFEIEGKITKGMNINDNYYDLYYMGKNIGG